MFHITRLVLTLLAFFNAVNGRKLLGYNSCSQGSSWSWCPEAQPLTPQEQVIHDRSKDAKIFLQSVRLLPDLVDAYNQVISKINSGLDEKSRWIVDLSSAKEGVDGKCNMELMKYENDSMRYKTMQSQDFAFCRFHLVGEKMQKVSPVRVVQGNHALMEKSYLQPRNPRRALDTLHFKQKHPIMAKMAALNSLESGPGFMLKSMFLAWKLYRRNAVESKYNENSNVIKATLEMYFVSAIGYTAVLGRYALPRTYFQVCMRELASTVLSTGVSNVFQIAKPLRYMRFAAYGFVAFTVAMEAVELGFSRGAEQTAFYSTQLYFDSVSLVAQSVVLGLIMFGFEGASELFLAVSVTAGAFSIPLAIAGIVMTGIVGHVMHMQRRSLDAAAMIQRIVDDYRMKMSIQVRNENAVVNFGTVTTDKRLNNAIVTTVDFNDPSTVRYAFGSQRMHKSLDWHEGKFVPFGTAPDPKKTFSLRKAFHIPEETSMYEYELRHARVVEVILPAALESVLDFEYGTAWGMFTRSSQSYPELKVVRQIQSNPQAHWYFEYYNICEMAVSKIFVEYFPTVVHINLGIHARYNLFVPSLKPAGRDKLTYNITAAEVDREQHIYVQLQAGVSFNIYRADGATFHVWELNCTLLSPSLCSPVFSPKDFQVGNVVFHAIPNKVIIVDRDGVLECQFVTRRCERKQELRAPNMHEDWDTNTETDHVVIERSRSCRSLQRLECTRITHPYDPVVEIPTTQTSRFLGIINDGTGVRAFHYNEDTSMLTLFKNSVEIPLVFPHGVVSVTRAWVVNDALSVILSDGLQFIISDTFAKYCHTMRASEGNSLQDVERQIMRLKEYYHMADILRLDLSKLGEEFTNRWHVSYVVRAKEFIVLNRSSNEIFSILGWDSSQRLPWYFAMSSCLGQCSNPRPMLYQIRGYVVPTGSHTGSIRESVRQISRVVARKSVNMHGETLATAYSTGTDVVIITEEDPGKMFRITASGDRYLRELDFRDINVHEEAPVALWCRADLVETTIRVSGLDRPVWCAPHHNLVVLGPRGTTHSRLNGWIDWILVGVTELRIPLLLNSRTGILYVSTEHGSANSIRVTPSRTVVSDDDLQWRRIEVRHSFLNKIASAFILGDTGEIMLLDQLGAMYVFHSNSAFARTEGTHITLVGVNNKWMANKVDGMHSSSYSEPTVPELHTTIRSMVTTFQEQTPSHSRTANFNVTVSPILTLGPPSLGLWYHTHCDQIIHTMPMPSPDNDCLLAQQLISYSCQTGIAFIYTPRTRIIYKKDAMDVTKFLRVDELHLMPKDHSSILIVCSKGERLQDPFEFGIDFIFSCSKRPNYHFVQYDEQRITAYDENDVATHHGQSMPLSC